MSHWKTPLDENAYAKNLPVSVSANHSLSILSLSVSLLVQYPLQYHFLQPSNANYPYWIPGAQPPVSDSDPSDMTGTCTDKVSILINTFNV